MNRVQIHDRSALKYEDSRLLLAAQLMDYNVQIRNCCDRLIIASQEVMLLKMLIGKWRFVRRKFCTISKFRRSKPKTISICSKFELQIECER
jgi:hypothetical protein